MANKLKKLHLTSVDLVRAGANQQADICIHKSAEDAESPAERETNIIKRFFAWLKENPTEPENEPETTVEKDYSTFNTLEARRESADKLWRYSDALTTSIRSIQEDNDLNADQKLEKMKQSLNEFSAAMEGLFSVLCSMKAETDNCIGKADTAEEKPQEEPEQVEKSEPDIIELEIVEKHNDNHDALGRFASAGGGGGGTISVHGTGAGGKPTVDDYDRAMKSRQNRYNKAPVGSAKEEELLGKIKDLEKEMRDNTGGVLGKDGKVTQTDRSKPNAVGTKHATSVAMQLKLDHLQSEYNRTKSKDLLEAIMDHSANMEVAGVADW